MGVCGSKSHAAAVHRPESERPSECSSPRAEEGPAVRPEPSAESVGRRPSVTVLAALASETAGRRGRLITHTRGDIAGFYALDARKLGEGAFGYVCKATSHETGHDRAVKMMTKERTRETRKRYRQEIVIMKMTDHPNIVKLFETFEDKQNLFLVMELCAGGDLSRRLAAVGRFGERDCALLMRQVLRPVFYLHEKRLCHRDVKPENYLFLSGDPVAENTLKLIDFGFSCTVKDGQALTTKLGTLRYSSPQVLAGQYNESCDLWSCGVILYVLLSGQQPFQGRSDADVTQSVRRGNYAFKGPLWQPISEQAKDLVRALLRYQPQERASAEEALRHPLLREDTSEASCLGKLLTPALLMDLRRFCEQSLFRRAALQVVAQQMSQEDTKSFRRAFAALDSRGAGVLSIGDLAESLAMDEAGREMQKVVSELPDEAEIGFTDFLAATLEARHYLQEGPSRAAFRAFDRDCDGCISCTELEEVLVGSEFEVEPPDVQLGSRREAPDVRAMMQAVDSNGDGVIDFQEFRHMLAGDNIAAGC